MVPPTVICSFTATLPVFRARPKAPAKDRAAPVFTETDTVRRPASPEGVKTKKPEPFWAVTRPPARDRATPSAAIRTRAVAPVPACSSTKEPVRLWPSTDRRAGSPPAVSDTATRR
ncbi:hypothetical protein [Desulfatiferula olefinivorans]